MRRAAWFSIACAGGVLAVLLLVWAFNGFAGMGLSRHGLVAMVLGVTLTTAAAVGLMAALFASERRRQGEIEYHLGPPPEGRGPPPGAAD